MHGQAASALSEMRSKYILDPISIRANHPFFGVGANFPSLGRGLRGPKQALDWLRAVCADPNRHSIGASGTPARFAGYKANSTSFLYQANSPSLGRGLREAKRMNALPL